MKYLLDIVLVVGLCWLGYMWNNEKQNGLAQGDEIDQLKANVAQLELDLGKAKDDGAKASSDLEATQAQLDQSAKELQGKTDALAAKTAEADKLRADLGTAVARVKELEGYKARAIVAEMPKPISAAP